METKSLKLKNSTDFFSRNVTIPNNVIDKIQSVHLDKINHQFKAEQESFKKISQNNKIIYQPLMDIIKQNPDSTKALKDIRNIDKNLSKDKLAPPQIIPILGFPIGNCTPPYDFANSGGNSDNNLGISLRSADKETGIINLDAFNNPGGSTYSVAFANLALNFKLNTHSANLKITSNIAYSGNIIFFTDMVYSAVTYGHICLNLIEIKPSGLSSIKEFQENWLWYLNGNNNFYFNISPQSSGTTQSIQANVSEDNLYQIMVSASVCIQVEGNGSIGSQAASSLSMSVPSINLELI
jgi:hypothetical protein